MVKLERWIDILHLPNAITENYSELGYSIKDIVDFVSKHDNKLRYINGNTAVVLDLKNGTRYMETINEDEEFNLEFPVSVDLNISNYCEQGCQFCYQNCTTKGKHADLEEIKKILRPYTEVALNINTGYPIDDKFINFLEHCKENNIIVNATINQNDLEDEGRLNKIIELQNNKLLHGIGISLVNKDKWKEEYLQIKNSVIHVIAGLVTVEELDWIIDNDLNVLLLGFKQKGRAETNKLPNMDYLKAWLEVNLWYYTNSVISFDNKAIEQLDVRKLISDEVWECSYCGDEGTISFYIDGVNMTFAQNSFATKNHNIGNMDIKNMFAIIKKESM